MQRPEDSVQFSLVFDADTGCVGEPKPAVLDYGGVRTGGDRKERNPVRRHRLEERMLAAPHDGAARQVKSPVRPASRSLR